jgi:hypothetical protein
MRLILLLGLFTALVASGCASGSGASSGALRGQVQDTAGNPVADAIIKLKFQNPKDGTFIDSTMTDREGKFRVSMGKATSETPVILQVVKLGFRKHNELIAEPGEMEQPIVLQPLSK